MLVILVVCLFLQSWRDVNSRCRRAGVSDRYIRRHAGAGVSITLTLFGMVLAIGIVVDDAIVVVENCERHMTQGNCLAKNAAKRAMEEVTGRVIAICAGVKRGIRARRLSRRYHREFYSNSPSRFPLP